MDEAEAAEAVFPPAEVAQQRLGTLPVAMDNASVLCGEERPLPTPILLHDYFRQAVLTHSDRAATTGVSYQGQFCSYATVQSRVSVAARALRRRLAMRRQAESVFRSEVSCVCGGGERDGGREGEGARRGGRGRLDGRRTLSSGSMRARSARERLDSRRTLSSGSEPPHSPCDGNCAAEQPHTASGELTGPELFSLGRRPPHPSPALSRPVVAVDMQPSVDLLVVLLAVLTEGAAYLPVDSQSAVNRVRYILNEAGPVCVVADGQSAFTAETHTVWSGYHVIHSQELLATDHVIHSQELLVTDTDPEGQEVTSEDSMEQAPAGQEGEHDDCLTFVTSSLTALSGQDEIFEEMSSVTQNEQKELDADDRDRLLAVIYTSGSTGMPKGVRVTHRAAMNRLSWQWDMFPFTAASVGCFKTSLLFVDSIVEIFGCVLALVPMVIAPRGLTSNPELLVALLEEHRVSRLVMVPSLLRSLLFYLSISGGSRRLPMLREWVCNSETLLPSLLARFFETFPEGRTFSNYYGSTETMADVTCEVFRGPEDVQTGSVDGVLSIGRPMYNCRVYLLDEGLRPVPRGEVGEICVSGANLAAGYVDRGHDTAFLPNPLTSDLLNPDLLTSDPLTHDPLTHNHQTLDPQSWDSLTSDPRTSDPRTSDPLTSDPLTPDLRTPDPGHQVLYHSGDFARLAPHRRHGHMLVYEGRRDLQVKIRGQRVNIAEVERVVQEVKAVERVMVLIHRFSPISEVIVAYYTTHRGSGGEAGGDLGGREGVEPRERGQRGKGGETGDPETVSCGEAAVEIAGRELSGLALVHRQVERVLSPPLPGGSPPLPQLRPGGRSTLVESQITWACRRSLPPYMRPKLLHLEEFPLQPYTGKVDRVALRRQYEKAFNRQSSLELAVLDTRSQKALNIIALNLNLPTRGVPKHSSFFELGGTSVSMMSTIVQLRQHGLHIPIELFSSAQNVQQIIDHVVESREPIGEILRTENYVVLPMHEVPNNEDIVDVLTESFVLKEPLDVLLGVTEEEFTTFAWSLYQAAARGRLSLIVLDKATRRIVGGDFLFDYFRGVRVEHHETMSPILTLFKEFEEPIRAQLSEAQPGPLLLNFCLCVHKDLPHAEQVKICHLIEGHVIQVAKDNGYVGVVTNNTNPVTQDICEYFYDYECLSSLVVRDFTYNDRKVFAHAPEDYSIKMMIKYV